SIPGATYSSGRMAGPNVQVRKLPSFMSQSRPLIGLVLVTHGRLALELVAAMEHVVGPQTQITTVCIGPEDNMEQRRADIMQAVETVNAGSGVVVLTDMFGGTPSNLAISIMDTAPVEVIAGVNL